MAETQKRGPAAEPARRRFGPAALALAVSVGVILGLAVRPGVVGWLKGRAHALSAPMARVTGDGFGRVASIANVGESITVRNPEEFHAAIAKVSSGGTILLAPGDYAGLRIHDRTFDSVVTITSLDIARPAVIHDLSITNSGGLRFHDLEYSTAGAAITAAGSTPDKRAEDTFYLHIRESSSIEFDHVNFHGDLHGTLFNDVTAMIMQDCRNVVIKNSEFQHFHNAINHFNTDHLVIANNKFHDLQDDAIRGGGSSYVQIIGNRFDSLHLDPNDKDHPDCIQFWTTNTTSAAHDILVKDNIYMRGRGRPVQGIFFKDEAKVHYISVTIQHNLISGALFNGISVAGAVDLTMSDNVVAQYDDQRSWITVRDVNRAALSHNRASLFSISNSTGVRETDDQILGAVHDQGAALLRAWRADPGRAALGSSGRSNV